MSDIFSLLGFWYAELLFFCAFWFFIGAIDDALVDLIWITRSTYRRWRYYHSTPPLRVTGLSPASQPGLMVIFIPTWREAAVIGHMLANCLHAWKAGKTRFRIFVGCYRNDPDGIAEVVAASRQHPEINLVICKSDGPTSKADCLNQLWSALVSDELMHGIKAKAVILHDAEDLVHKDELYIFDRLIEQRPAVQLPVLPLPLPGSTFVSGHYCDEFAEAHGKSLIVREAIGASVPLAGVGCAIDRHILGKIALLHNHLPFDTTSLTEDYELGFEIGKYGQTILVRMLDSNGDLVCSRAYFPADIKSSVKQKARWMTGIALAGWDKLGWRGGVAQKWMLLRDRKAVFAAMILSCAYICMVLTAILAAAWNAGLYSPAPLPGIVVWLLWANFAFLIWRIGVRCLFVTKLYGWRQGLISIPRTFAANIISIMAARRACFAYLKHIFGGPLGWDKTEHRHIPIATRAGKNV